MEGSAPGRLSRTIAGGILILAAATGVGRGFAPAPAQRGVFALLGGTPKIASELWTAVSTSRTSMLFIRQYRLGGTTPVRDYDVDMQKLIHLIIVRDDFATFAHVHPAFDPATGTFSQRFTKEPQHRYYAYADTDPHGIGHQVFRFTIESDGPAVNARPPAAPSSTTSTVGPYTVGLSSRTLPANRPQEIDITVERSGKPARDLQPYLGAAAHAVFINTATLQYVHLHPMLRGASAVQMKTGMNMPMSTDSAAGPAMQLNLPALPPAIYALWLQFRGGDDRIYTAPFTMLVR